MTLRRRLFVTVAVLVALVIGLSVVLADTRAERRATLDLFTATYNRERQLAELDQCLADHHRQLTLLAQTFTGTTAEGAPTVGVDADIRATFRSGMAHCRQLAVSVLADPVGAPADGALAQVADDVATLVDAWTFVVDNLGTNHVEALSRQALVADPLTEKLIRTTVPEARREQSERLAEAQIAFARTSDRADALMVAALLVVLLAVVALAVGFLRRLLVGLGALERGMDLYGRGNFDHRVVLNGADEIAAVATQINAMAERLAENRVELEQRTVDLQRTVDELRTTQAAMVQQEKMAALGGLVAGVAHEVNTPLGVSVTTASLIQDHINELRVHTEAGTATKGIVRRTLSSVDEGTRLLLENLRRAATLIQSFKQVAVDRGEVSTREVVLAEWTGGIVQSLSPVLRRHGVRAESAIPEGLRVVLAAGELEQVLTNLLVNACVHGFPEDGADAPPVDARRVTVAVHFLAAHLAIEVADNGVGMPAEVAARVFEPFYTTRRGRGGTGLGMHIVHQLVAERFGGRITVDSEPGKGTRWNMTLPFPTDALRPAAEEPSE
jgi:two-component system NtrC family sensor kinase